MKENWELHWKDYYKILQVQPLAEPEVIKAAYDRLARKYHPDTNKGSTTLDRMKELNEAFEVLGNPQKRTVYDVTYNQSKTGYTRPINTSNPSEPQPETSSKVTPDVTEPGVDTGNQVSNSRSGTKRRKVKRLPVFAGILAIAIVIVLSIVLLHFNKAPNSNQSQTYTVGLPAITLIYPIGGETLHIGDVIKITWTSTNIPADAAVNVSLSLASTQPYTPSVIIKIGSTTNTGSFTWIIQGDQFVTTNGTGDYAKVLIEAMGTSDMSAKGFTIAQ